jgi:hypothetical protein
MRSHIRSQADVRNVVHYGWPQSLEQYFQEAGRAGRDGKKSNCVLFADLSTMPSLLPSKSGEGQTRHKLAALKALYMYAIRCNSCRVRQILEYFGEQWPGDRAAQGCGTCDACVVGVNPEEDYFHETGTMLDIIERKYANDRQSCWTALCKDLVGKCNRGKHFWRGLCRQLIEHRFVVDDGIPSESQLRNTINTVACPQPTDRGLEVLRAWQQLHTTGVFSDSGQEGASASSAGNVIVGSDSSLRRPFKAPRQGLQSDLGSWRALASLDDLARREPILKVATHGNCARASLGAGASGSNRASGGGRHAVMLRPEGDMLPGYEKKSPSPWADSEKRTEMLAQMRITKKGKWGGKKGKKRRKGKKVSITRAAGRFGKAKVKKEAR